MEGLQEILKGIMEENKDKYIMIIKDDKGNIIESSHRVNFKEMHRYPSEGYYKYNSKFWSLSEIEVMHRGKLVTIQIYINITDEIEERKSLKKDKETNLIMKEHLEGVLNKLAKPLKTTSKGVTLILFEYDKDNLNKYDKTTKEEIIKNMGENINYYISQNDYGFRMGESSFIVVIDNCSHSQIAVEKAEQIQILGENKTYQLKNDKNLTPLAPIIYFGIASIGTTRIPNNDPMTLLDLAKDNLNMQKSSRREIMDFIESENLEDEENIKESLIIC